MEWLRIGEVARRTGLTHRTLRHYDDLGLLVPSGRSDGDYRLYAREDLERLLAIQHLKSLGLGLTEVQQALDDPGFDAGPLLEQHARAVEIRIAEEQELLRRLRALRSVAALGWDEVLDTIALTERLRHPEAHVRFRAALTDPTTAPAEELVERLRSDPEPGVREAATWALVQHGESALGPIMALADGDEQARHSLAHVLGKLRSPEAVPTLGGLLADASEMVAAKAAFSLGQIGGASAVDALSAALEDPRPAVREEVTASLGRLPEAEPALVNLATHRVATVRAHALEALGLLGLATPTVLSALGDPDPEVQFAAVFALANATGPDVTAALQAATASSDPRVRLVAQRLSRT